MRHFINNPAGALQGIEVRARRSCVRFRNRELPRSCRPARADIGFESVGPSGGMRLYVQHGIDYEGDSGEFRNWLEEGHKDFPDFESLVRWIKGPVREEFRLGEQSRSHAVASTGGPHRPVTDLPALRDRVREAGRPPLLDEGALFERLARRVRGQDHAIRSLVSVVVRHSARRQPKRPAVLFAVGPSGVGKTQSAESLAEALGELTPDENGYRFLRLDMTEYQESHRVSQLLGAPQGYVGHDEGSQLLDALEANPRTIVLFDEIEKSHPAILRVLMNAMDAGRLSRPSRGSSGHDVDCRQAVFIFTSNLDAKAILDDLEDRKGFGDRAAEDEVCRRRLHASGIAPEIVGRIGRFLVYRKLPAEVRAEIMALSIIEVAAEYGLKIDYVEPEVILALMGKTPPHAFGMRPDQYLIDEHLGDLFAKAASAGSVPSWRVAGPPFQCLPIRETGTTPRARPARRTNETPASH